MNPAQLVLEPIGHVRTGFGARVEAPRQPAASAQAPGRIELLPGRNFEHALEDLAGWEHLWVIFWFHLNAGWRPKVLPPRSRSGRKGVFATRAPHRPNPLGLSAVRLERIEGLTLHVSGVDMVDGTPVLDLKPYVPYSDAHPDARSGWLDGPSDPVAPWRVSFDALAAAQAEWIAARTGFDIAGRIVSTLALGPEPHPYRRIRREGSAGRLAVQDWRVRFAVDGADVRVAMIGTGYRAAELAAAAGNPPDDPRSAHCEFIARWPG
jgi:tRNA-Thr(GGU) m(6)t(6)A37 methyltransferase TsaA